MSRPIADTPSFLNDAPARDREAPSWNVLSLEAQLWIEVFLLMGFGVVMIYSASSILAIRKYGDAAHYLKRQLICMGLGAATMLVFSRVPLKKLLDRAHWLLLLIVIALFLVLIPGVGVEVNNARRWFQVKGFSFQPAEYAKVIWVMVLSVSLSRKQENVKRFSVGFLPHIIVCGVLSGLIIKEPDFGTTFMIGCLTVVMLAVGGTPLRHLFLLVPVAFLGLYRFVYRVPYRWERITAFLNPWTDPLDSGYQLIQAWIAVGSGGIWGKGLGAGQQKLFYLPESYTDFIFAVIGEELGFVGIAIICALFLALFRTGIKISRVAPDHRSTLVALGFTMLLSLQALLNMGVVLGLVPTKGLPLPFISYGGSAFTANCMAIGILMNIARNGERQTAQNV
ncbi:MAG: putative lipid II flippase FtsW [Syntrophobacteraceae bacterium]|nr:putative lipid II flippase FtsW [Syntrophobacteraceae bacterium]